MKMNFHIIFLVLGAIVSLCSLVSVFYVPWIHVKAPISKGYYDIHVFLDIGLLQCYSDVCKKYSDIEYFLEVKLPQFNDQYFNISSPYSSGSTTDGIDFNFPKLPNLIQLEKQSLDSFMEDFKLVSKITIFNISVSITLLLIFFLLFFYDICLFHMIILFPKLYDTLLLTAVCFYVLGTVSYVYVTITRLEDGHYEQGVWISMYTCLFGIVCCIVANWCPGWHTRAQLLTPYTSNTLPSSTRNPFHTAHETEADDLTPLLQPSSPSSAPPNYHTYVFRNPVSGLEMLWYEAVERGHTHSQTATTSAANTTTSTTVAVAATASADGEEKEIEKEGKDEHGNTNTNTSTMKKKEVDNRFLSTIA